EGAAAADVGDLAVDVGVGRLGLGGQQGSDRHDHAGLAVSALRNVVVDPGLLHLVQNPSLGEPLDGRDLLALGGAHRQRARAHGLTVDMHRASTALGYSAPVLGAGQADVLANHPEQRCVRVDIDVVRLSIDGQTSHVVFSLACAHYSPAA